MSAATETVDPTASVCCVPLTAAPLGDGEAAALAETYAALADPVRLKLLSLIAAAGELCSCDMVEPLDGHRGPTPAPSRPGCS